MIVQRLHRFLLVLFRCALIAQLADSMAFRTVTPSLRLVKSTSLDRHLRPQATATTFGVNQPSIKRESVALTDYPALFLEMVQVATVLENPRDGVKSDVQSVSKQ